MYNSAGGREGVGLHRRSILSTNERRDEIQDRRIEGVDMKRKRQVIMVVSTDHIFILQKA